MIKNSVQFMNENITLSAVINMLFACLEHYTMNNAFDQTPQAGLAVQYLRYLKTYLGISYLFVLKGYPSFIRSTQFH